jgi:hyaluronoglucosaminidase
MSRQRPGRSGRQESRSAGAYGSDGARHAGRPRQGRCPVPARRTSRYGRHVPTSRTTLTCRLASVGVAMLALLGSSTPAVAGPRAAPSPWVAGPDRTGPGVARPEPDNAGGGKGGNGGRSGVAGVPAILPRPQRVARNGEALRVPDRVDVLVGGVDQPTTDLVVATLKRAGASRVDVHDLAEPARGKAALTVVVGTVADAGVDSALQDAGADLPADLPAEGYVLAGKAARDGGGGAGADGGGAGGAGGGVVVLAGRDGDGSYYAAQTFRQLVVRPRQIAAVKVVDHPLMRLRGVIEGFYGSPWTHAERLDQLAFYGQVKMNTYVYAPKDDPYHREKWREPYPADKLAELGELVGQADRHHVRFTFAVSPGVSICYSDPADVQALEAKLQAMYGLGVRSFSVPLDDITYTRWNCAADEEAYGPPSAQAAAQAQVDLLNAIQQDFLDERSGTRPLQMVPTEYGDVQETAYKRTIRTQLDPRVEVMWTGTDVVPPRITVNDAAKAATVWGRKVFVWDNYPVNDFDRAEGRLLLAPYAEREPGLHEQLTGIVLNPMNQAAASKVALFGGADFTWHDTGYEPEPTSAAAAAYLAGGDPRTAEALLAFFDLEHLAPTFGAEPWQPPAPVLAARLAEFRTSWEAGDREAAVAGLRPYARLLARAPDRIRSGVVDSAFVADSQPWLDATELWGAALLPTLDGLQARADGDEAEAERRFDQASSLAEQAGAIETIPGETRPQGPVRVADGVLDVFVAEAPDLR